MDRATAITLLRGGADGIKEFVKRRLAGVKGYDPARTEPSIIPEIDLSEADLRGLDLRGAIFIRAFLDRVNFDGCCLEGASFGSSSLSHAQFCHANLSKAKINDVNCIGTQFRDANLTGSFLQLSNFLQADMTGANLTDANLQLCSLVETNLQKANLTGCKIYGISVWDVNLTDAIQRDLVVQPTPDDALLTVDNLDVAQFVFQLYKSKSLKSAIETVSSKCVLILGRFSIPNRKAVLDAIRTRLREMDLCPLMFDFDRPTNMSHVETVEVLARLSRCVIADFTDPRVVIQEAEAVTRAVVPFLPIFQEGGDTSESVLFDIDRGRKYVMPLYKYRDEAELLAALPMLLVKAEQIRKEMASPARL